MRHFFQRIQRDLPKLCRCIILIRKRCHKLCLSCHLHSLQFAKALIFIKNGQTHILILFQCGKLLAAFGKHPECTMMIRILDRCAAHKLSRTRCQCTGFICQNILFHCFLQLRFIQLYTFCIFFLPVGRRLFIFFMGKICFFQNLFTFIFIQAQRDSSYTVYVKPTVPGSCYLQDISYFIVGRILVILFDHFDLCHVLSLPYLGNISKFH